MRIFSLLTVVATSLLGAAIASASEPTVVTMWGLSLGADSKGLEAVIRTFEQKHPEYKVRVLSMGAGGMNPQKLMTSIVGGVAPDAVNQDRFTISDWAARNAFRPLDDLIARDKNTDPNCPTPDRYYKSIWTEGCYGDHVYGIPTGADDRILYYNKTLFAKKSKELQAAGLDPNRPPRTWSEVLAYSKVLTEFNPDHTLKVAGFMPNYGNSWLYMFAFQNNASFLSADGQTCTLNTKPAQDALAYMKSGYDLIGGYATAKTFESGFQGGENDPFVIGKVAMKIDGDWILNNISRYGPNLDFGVGPPPVPDDRLARKGPFAGEKDDYITWIGGFSYAIPRGAKHVEGAWQFIKFATSAEGRHVEMLAQREWERRRGRIFVPKLQGNIQANESIKKEFLPADDRLAAALQQHIDLLPKGRIRPATPVGQVLWDEHVRAIENACNGTLGIEAALQAGQAVVQRELDAIAQEKSRPLVNMAIPTGLAIALLAGAAIYAIFSFRRKKLGKLERSDAMWAYAFITPWIIGFAVLTVGPMVASIFFSFTQYNVLSDARWAGIDNYRALVTVDWPKVYKAFSNVFYLGGIGVPLGLVTGLAVALLLNTGVRGMRFYRTAFYLPAIVPTVASAVLWMWLLTPDPSKGLINVGYMATFGKWFNLPPPGWLTVHEWAKPALVFMGGWGAGSGMLLWLAGLKGISSTLYEAASIDGASPTKQLLYVTLPQLSPIIFFNLVMGFIGALQEFDRIYVMFSTTAGPSDTALTPVLHLFTNGFNYFKMGYASALAWVIFIVIMGLTFIQFKLSPRWVHYESDR